MQRPRETQMCFAGSFRNGKWEIKFFIPDDPAGEQVYRTAQIKGVFPKPREEATAADESLVDMVSGPGEGERMREALAHLVETVLEAAHSVPISIGA